MIPQTDVKLELDDPPTLEEIKKTTMQLKVGKSPDTDGIPAEVYQHGEKQCSMGFRICSPVVGRKGLYRRTSGMQSLSLCTKSMEKTCCKIICVAPTTLTGKGLMMMMMGGSSSSSFTFTWEILASEDSCTVCWSQKRPSKCSDQCWRVASLSFSRVLPSEEGRGAWI